MVELLSQRRGKGGVRNPFLLRDRDTRYRDTKYKDIVS